MLKKTVLIEKKSKVNCKNRQLIIKNESREGSIPIEEIGFIVIDNPEVYISITAMNLLVENNASVIICNASHLPNGMFLNLNSHHIQQEIFRNQINASLPLKKKLWQQTIKQKIQNQGILLKMIQKKDNTFPYLASKVLSGDTSNMEGVAANFYWKFQDHFMPYTCQVYTNYMPTLYRVYTEFIPSLIQERFNMQRVITNKNPKPKTQDFQIN